MMFQAVLAFAMSQNLLDKDWKSTLGGGGEGVACIGRVEAKEGHYLYTFRVKNTGAKNTYFVSWQAVDLATGCFWGGRHSDFFWELKPGEEAKVTLRHPDAPRMTYGGTVSLFERGSVRGWREFAATAGATIYTPPAFGFRMAAGTGCPLPQVLVDRLRRAD